MEKDPELVPELCPAWVPLGRALAHWLHQRPLSRGSVHLHSSQHVQRDLHPDQFCPVKQKGNWK